MLRRALVMLVGIVTAAVATAGAQSTDSTGGPIDVEAVRAYLITGFENNRLMDIDFTRAIPDSALRWAPNDVVRDFAEQIEHAANNTWAAASALGVPAPSFGDSAQYLNNKELMVAAITRSYDWVIEGIRSLPAEEFTAMATLFGQRMPTWRIYAIALQHTNWTRGQLVPYYHAHGVPVPRFRLY